MIIGGLIAMTESSHETQHGTLWNSTTILDLNILIASNPLALFNYAVQRCRPSTILASVEP